MSTLTTDSMASGTLQADLQTPVLGFVLLWSRDEPGRIGEISLMPSMSPGTRAVLGRGEAAGRGQRPRLEWMRQQPGRSVATGPLCSLRISRTQLEVEVVAPGALRIENRGRRALWHNNREVDTAVAGPGDIIELHRAAMFLCVERPYEHAVSDLPLVLHDFGSADAHGIVGESLAAWALRARIAFFAEREAHVLLRGPSGVGKELAAQAIHRLSQRGHRPLVARNAATFPETLIDAELFGNARGFPNPGTPERPGLLGEADGSTLFLDEFAELPQALQVHLLRVLDAGEYMRLGEARPRRSDFRLIAATNRPEGALKEDVLARLPLRIELPGLGERREDIPLIARHLLRRIASTDVQVARRYFPNGDPSAEPCMSSALIAHLVRHPYTTHTRELLAMLWRSIAESSGDVLQLWPGAVRPAPTRASISAASESTLPGPDAVPAGPSVDPLAIAPEVIQACLDRHGGLQEPVWRELRLSSRHVLTRLVRRYGLQVRGRR